MELHDYLWQDSGVRTKVYLATMQVEEICPQDSKAQSPPSRADSYEEGSLLNKSTLRLQVAIDSKGIAVRLGEDSLGIPCR